ncbi:hypothetical protein BD779DRAFT_1610027 [Infundibulicybe gibba]|nr:hypothetical protein BD779DRAFT_1610027 [Infundibulicybe gibba]
MPNLSYPIDSHLERISAPMINQSDHPFRRLVTRHGATMVYTQMLLPERLRGARCPVVVQFGGNDIETIVQAGRKLQGHCDAIGGCTVLSCQRGHYGAYLLGQRDWGLVQGIGIAAMSHSFTVPVSAKLRLCAPSEKTPELAKTLESCGASWVTLHARTVSAHRRRQGSARLDEVKRLKENLRIPVISNGNVRVFSDIARNLEETGADGVMVAESLLRNPCLFEGIVPDPISVSLEYLDLCRQYPGTSIGIIQTHIRHFIESNYSRRPWFPKFRTALGQKSTVDDIEAFLTTKVERWRTGALEYEDGPMMNFEDDWGK